VFTALVEGPRFKREDIQTSAFEVISWWESRRLFYNGIVGIAGVACCVLVIACAVLSEATIGEAIGLPDGPLLGVFAIIAYGILANLCYTAGWVCELIVRSVSTSEKSTSFGLKSFRIGVQFSVLLTLLPAAICWIILALALITGHKPQASPE
jgi:hypothetical protein